MRIYGGALDRPRPWEDLLLYETEVHPDDPVEDALIRAVAEFGPYDSSSWLTQGFAPISEHVMEPAKVMSALLDPIYGVSGQMVILRDRSSDISWGEVWAASADHLYPESVREKVFIAKSGGFGGGMHGLEFLTPELISHLAIVASFVTGHVLPSPLKAAGDALTQQGRDQILRWRGEQAPLSVQRQARAWAEQGLGDEDKILNFVFRRRFWPLHLFATRLRMDEQDAQRLLMACGWRPDDTVPGSWIPTVSRDQCHRAWLKADAELLQPGSRGDSIEPP